MMMDRFFTKSMCRQLMALALLSLICMSDGHLIKKRHDGSVVSNGNESNPQPEIDEASETDAEGIHSGIEVTNNGNDNNDVNNTPEIKVTSTTDVNNGIEQNFTGNTNSTNQTVNETIASINGTNQTVTNLQKANFTKEISQDDSVENKLPSKLSDKSEPVAKPIARIAAVSLKDDENKEIQSTRTQPSNPSEKPKRLDTTFARSTERTVAADIEVSTVPVSQSTASILSTIVQSPKIAATEKIPSRISSISMPEMTEKRAKFLSEKLETSSPSTAHNPDASWSNLKTVGEVHHNNVTLGIKSVNGKLDSEEVAESSHSSESAAAQKDGEEHETQLQKSNSSQISDVSDDNSLSSLQSSSSSHRPTNSVTPKIKTTEFDESKQAVDKEQPTEIPKTKVTDVMQTTKVTELKEEHPKIVDGSTAAGISSTPSGVSPSVLNSTERSKAEESTERVTENVTEPATEKDVYTTTEEDEPTTTIEVETVMPNDTTTLSHIPTVKTKENLVVETTTATAMIPTTETTDVPTTIYVSSPKEDENKVHHEYIENVVPVQPTESIQSNQSFSINSNTTPMVEIESTTPEITKVFVHPTKPITTKANSTEINQKVINDGKVREPIFSSTSTTERSVTTTVLPVNESTDAPLLQTTTFVSVQPKSPPETDTVTPESLPPEHTEGVAQGEIGEPADVNAMIAIGISLVAVITLILLVGFLLVMRKRQKQLTYGQRCRPIGLDAYSLDNISVYNSVRRKSAMRTSKRAFGNAGFDDPGLKNNPLSISQLATFSQKRVSINEEFKDIPTVTARIEEVPVGCEDKNRYANVVPLPESRVHLKQVDDDEKTEYINANFVKGPKDTTHYYIACQAPLEHTVIDFWRMIWEQNSRVIIMATDLTENGIEKCAEYLPSSFVIDNHVTFGDYQITLKNREVRDKYAMSTVHLKNECTKTWREITHFWYQWPENGVPIDEASVIAMLLEARSYLKMVTPEQSDKSGQAESDLDNKIGNGNADKTKSLQRVQGPLTVHCSPGTGRTGTIIACDIAIRSLEQPARNVDVPQIVYFVRRGRASAVQTREQYEFIYKVAHVYATKLTGPVNDN